MKISVDNSSGKPLYEQIYDSLKKMILDGSLKQGDMLPTIRSLAQDLRISVITTSRAYSELEKEGFIYSTVGKGSFVAEKNPEFYKEQNMLKIEEKISEAAELAKRSGIGDDEFLEIVKLILKG